MQRLIIIAAPSCCGKTRFVSKLRNGELPSITQLLQMGDVHRWEYKDVFFANRAMVSDLSRRQVPQMILHWTIPHPSLKLKIRNLLLGSAYDKKVRLDLIKMAKNVTCLSLIADPDTLIERVGLREVRVQELRAEGRDSILKYKRKMRDTRALAAIYSDIQSVVPMYEKWFSFCEQIGVAQHYLVDVNTDPVLASIDSWSDIVARWQRPPPH